MSFDIEEIQSQFDKVIIHSQNYYMVNSNPLFAKWEENKRWFIEANGGNLIYEYPEPISFEIDEKEKMSRIDSFIHYLANFNDKIAEFIYANRFSFYDNITKEEYKYGDKIIIPKGMKITRAMKFFERDKNLLDKFQTKMSMMLQENFITGTLCLSVHPLDFLSSSENTYNWRSCHSLDGEYRAGNLSYMCDSSTVICYLKGEKDVILPHFPNDVPWNNKKWRMLLFFSTNRGALFAGRQYPFFNRSALNYVQNIVRDQRFVSTAYGWSNWTSKTIDKIKYDEDWTEFLSHPHFVLGGDLYKSTDLIKDSKTALHYNDLLKSTVYKPFYCWTNRSWGLHPREMLFKIGADVPCLYCGVEHINISGSMYCDTHELEYGTYDDCDMFCYCEVCGERMFVDDRNTHALERGGYVCSSCADDTCIECDNCGYYVWKEDAYYSESRDTYYCEECYPEDD